MALGNATGENNHLHVMDDQQRVALVRVGATHPADRGPAMQYHLGDHLGSSAVVIDQDGNFINREEYTPYGETSFGGFAKKRYRFMGKERDEESGLSYCGARYFGAWILRWASVDPEAHSFPERNPFDYTIGNPIRLRDPTGRQPEASRDWVKTKEIFEGSVAEFAEHTTICLIKLKIWMSWDPVRYLTT